MKLSQGTPFPGGSGGQSATGTVFEGFQSGSGGTTWIQGVGVLVLLGLGVYIGINLARKIPYRKLLQGVAVGLAIWVVLSVLPALVTSPPGEVPIYEPGLALTPELPYEINDLGRPPESFVRTIAAISLALVVLVALWLVRRSFHRPALLDNIRKDAETALAALQDGQDVKNVIIRCYLQMQQELRSEQGLEPETWLTPREFQDKMVALGLPAGPTGQLTHLFEEVRYGHKPGGPGEERLAVQCLSELVQNRNRER